MGGGGEGNPSFWFNALICQVFEIEHLYLVYLFTIHVGIPESILVRVGERGVFGGVNSPFQFQPLTCKVFEVENLKRGKIPNQQLTPDVSQSICLSVPLCVRPSVCRIFLPRQNLLINIRFTLLIPLPKCMV